MPTEIVAPMYNLTVSEVHTYFVGAGQWVVHNACVPREVLDRARQSYSIPQNRWDHAFDSHAHEWFGVRQPETRTESNIREWDELIAMSTGSNKAVYWRTGVDDTIGHLIYKDGKPLFVQYYYGGSFDGQLATAFIPSNSQLQRIRTLLGEFD